MSDKNENIIDLGNIIIQWGMEKMNKNNQQIIFNKPYKNNVIIQLTPLFNNEYSDGWFYHKITKYTLQDFTVQSADIEYVYIMWIAIGY